MWLMTNFGFFSVVRKTDGEELTVRARTRGDLDRLRGHYLPELGASVAHAGTDYPWRAVTQRAALSAAMSRIADDIDYPNFKDEVAKTIGKERAKRYAKIWSALYDMPEDLPEPESREDQPLPWPAKPPKGKAVAYGGLVVDRCGRLLLRRVRGDYDGYVWTFAKGRPEPDESARATALREVLEETGVSAVVIAPIAGEFLGGTTINRYFLMIADERRVSLDHQCKETDGLCWAVPDEARRLISLTTNMTGRTRDLSLVEAAAEWLPGTMPLKRPTALRTDWKRRPMAANRTVLPLDDDYSQAQMARIWRGVVPSEMEDKWFAYFADGVLHLHRSCTGFAIFRVFFDQVPGGWRANRVEVTRHPGHYLSTDDAENSELASNLVRGLLAVPDVPTVSDGPGDRSGDRRPASE
jgi:8-oxo-dGTP pyrophosphatase MutT (NUDIX family)